jgi:hypothetical protein
LLTDIRCNFLLETNMQRKSSRNGKKHFYSSFLKQQFCYGITTLSKCFRNGTEMAHLQRKDSLQCIETGCETLSSVNNRNYIFISGKFWGEKHLCNDNFRFTEKRIPFCQETIVVSIRLQHLCNNLIWRRSLTESHGEWAPCMVSEHHAWWVSMFSRHSFNRL